MQKLCITAYLSLLSIILFAQSQTQNSLLWEISGNGLKKPSYLFGTMHVSQKVAFHLGETWYKSIDSVDVIAMETAPETWLKDLISSDLISSSFRYAMRMNFNNSKAIDLERYAIGKDRNSLIASALQEDPSVINSILYRYSSSQGDFEEDSWLDMYLYQTGKKLNKLSAGLESFNESMQSITNASKPDDDEEVYNYALRNYKKQIDLQQQIQSAYRNGDLNLLDSLTRKSSSKNQHKYIIVERNERFISRLDSMLKKQSVFAGVGAAHLGGEKGMINLLQKLGYTVKPVVMGERDAERRNKLDSIIFEVPFKKYVSSDSIISFEVPSDMQELFSIGTIKSEVGTELINGAYYSLYRIKTYSSLVDGNTKDTWKMVDSLLYDNIPGKILEQKETQVNGYKALDISARARKGNIIRMRIILLPEELVVLKVSAPEERAKSFLGDKFLFSVNINTNTTNGWQKFTLPDKSLSVQLPAKPVFYGIAKLTSTITKTDLVAHDEKNQCDYICMNVKQKTSHYFEEDTFELSRIVHKLIEANKYTEKKRTLVTYKGRKALKVQLKVNEQRTIDAMVVIQNRNYYVFAVYYNKTNPDVSKFFESVEFGVPVYNEFYPLEDSTLFFTTQTATKPKNDFSGSLLKLSLGGSSDEKFNKDEVITKEETYSDENNIESIDVSLFKYSKYFHFKDEATFINTARYYITNYNDFIIKDEKITRNPNGLQMDFTLTDTNSTQAKLCRIILKNSAKYVLTANIDPLLGPSQFVKKFYDEFKPIDSITGQSLFIDKSDLFFNDLNSGDTTRINFARKNIQSVQIPAEKQAKLISLFGSLPAMDEYPAFKTSLYGLFKNMPGKSTLDFLKAEYQKAGDTASYQVEILQTLAALKSPEATIAFKELITADPPLDDESSTLLQLYQDSADLAALLFPDLFQLLNYDEYKDDVYHLLSVCVWKGKISPDLYKDKVNAMLSTAKTQLKRILSNVEEDDSDYGVYEYTNRLDDYNYLLFPFRKQENIKAHYDKILASDNKDIKYEVLECMVEMKGEIPVSTINELAADNEYRLYVYKLLNENNQQALFPASQKKQELFVKSALKKEYYSIEVDSAVLLDKRIVEWRNKKGYIYLYKYKTKDSKGDKYNLAAVGIVPENENELVTKFDISSPMFGNVLDKDEKLDKQLSDLLYDTLTSNRTNNYFDETKIDSNEEEYLYRLYSYED